MNRNSGAVVSSETNTTSIDQSLNNVLNLNNNHNNETVRDVHRAGWLRYLPFAEKSSNALEEHRFWVVFSVHNESEPYLEFYQKRQISPNWSLQESAGGPVSTHSLSNCQHISSAIVVNDKCYNEFAITLNTHVIRLVAETQQLMHDWIETLKNKLRQLNIIEPKDNLYTKDPQLPPRRNSWRPLPPLPTVNRRVDLEIAQIASSSSAQSTLLRPPIELYEAIFDTTNNRPQRPHSLEPLSSQIPLDEGPPPYESISVNDLTPVSLRESQVLRLRKEIAHPSGVRLMVRKKDCHNSIGLIDLSNNVWIAGWKQKEFPFLHNTFHIGDQLLSINGNPVANASQAYKMIKHNDLTIELIVKRVPNGRVFCIRRKTDGQDLGFTREKNTAEIKEVLNGGLADRAGLTAKYCLTEKECNWCLTEINNRPLNLFFKNNEIQDRLNAVGKEISILVQPLDFVKQLKKQLKLFRNYKDYIVQ